jgi:protein TonB
MNAMAYRQPLSPGMRIAILAAVIFFHVGGGWALTQIKPNKLVVGEASALEVRMVPAEQPVQLETPPPEDTPPPEPEPPQLESMIQPPLPDLPPPAFPIAAPPLPPKPKPPPPKPQPPKPQAAPVAAAPQAAPPAAPAAPRTVSMSQVAYVNPPNAIYPTRSRRAGEQGRVLLRVLVDVSGRPAQVALAKSSGHAALDESALSAVRAASFRPYAEGGVPQPVWVNVPIDFVLQ